MRLKRTILLLLGSSMLLVACTIAFLIYYIHENPGPIPPRVVLGVICFNLLGTIAIVLALARDIRKQVRTETIDQGSKRRVFAAKALKLSLILWTLIFLNDIRMLLLENFPWKYAIPGMTVVVVLIVTSWISLRRLKSSEIKAIRSGPQQ